MTRFDPAKDLSDLGTLYGVLAELLTLDSALLETVVPARSAWCSAQHLAHVALANELVLRNLKSLAEGRGALIVRGGELDPRALHVLESGHIPRGQAQSPRMVRPPEVVRRELLEQWLTDGRRALAALDPRMLGPTELKIPHQLLGPLDAPQWARFAVVHTRHHLAIVEEIRGELARTSRRA